jgi:hypothetical protein
VRTLRLATFLVLAMGASSLVACSQTPLAEIDEIYSDSDDTSRRVLCSANLDSSAEIPLDSVLGGLERAHENGEVIHLYAHSPGRSVPIERLTAVLDRASELGLDYLTYAELGDARATAPTGALALSFDDSNITEWFGIRELLAAHGAHATFFVTRFDLLNDLERSELHALQADGHAIEAHGLRHLNAPDYVMEYGLDAYMTDEVLPSLELLRADGFQPTAYAYPYGRRTDELDEALLQVFDRVRSVSFAYEGLVSDPCPE